VAPFFPGHGVVTKSIRSAVKIVLLLADEAIIVKNLAENLKHTRKRNRAAVAISVIIKLETIMIGLVKCSKAQRARLSVSNRCNGIVYQPVLLSALFFLPCVSSFLFYLPLVLLNENCKI